MKKIFFYLLLTVLFFSLTSCDSTNKVENIDEKPIIVEVENINEKPIIVEEQKTTDHIVENNTEVATLENLKTIEHSAEFYNGTGRTIDELYLVRGSDYKNIASVLSSDESIFIDWTYEEKDNFDRWGSPYFIIVIDGEEIPITKSKIISNDAREELYITSKWSYNDDANEVLNDVISFFYDNGEYYFAPQKIDIFSEISYKDGYEEVQYLYLPQVERWLLQEEGQLLFVAGMSKEEFSKYFPDYTEELPMWAMGGIISSETIFMEDVGVAYNDNAYTAVEIRYSDELQEFTTDDVMVTTTPNDINFISDNTYFRFIDKDGNVHRYEVFEQQRDGNNGGQTMNKLDVNNSGFTFIPLEVEEMENSNYNEYKTYHNRNTYYSMDDGLYIFKSNGETEKIIDINKPFDINIIEDKIVFYSQEELEEVMYRANLDGTSLEKINM